MRALLLLRKAGNRNEWSAGEMFTFSILLKQKWNFYLSSSSFFFYFINLSTCFAFLSVSSVVSAIL